MFVVVVRGLDFSTFETFENFLKNELTSSFESLINLRMEGNLPFSTVLEVFLSHTKLPC